jgi:vanillate O-demethylase ferredoxin subunit
MNPGLIPEPPWLRLQVQARWQPALNTVALRLAAKDGQDLPPFDAGAYIDVLTPGGHLRPYSLCNAPHRRDRYEITVLREPHGRGGSISLCDQVRVGDWLRVRPPVNEFALVPHAVHTVLLGAGIGMAPLLSMAEALWHRGAPFELHCVARSAAHDAFHAQLRKSAHQARVHRHWTADQGRPDLEMLLRRSPVTAEVFVCGPRAFIDGAATAMRSAGRSSDRLHIESFAPPKAAGR